MHLKAQRLATFWAPNGAGPVYIMRTIATRLKISFIITYLLIVIVIDVIILNFSLSPKQSILMTWT